MELNGTSPVTIQLVVDNNEDSDAKTYKYKAKIYINGAEKGYYKYSNDPKIVESYINVGKRIKGNTVSILNANIYSVRVYNRALNENEIKNNYELDKVFFSD